MFGSGDSQVISDNNDLFDYTCVGNVARARRLTGNELVPRPSYSSTTSSEPKLGLDSVTTKSSESLYRALPPICATTKYHHTIHGSMRTLSPYVTPPPNTESILSAFSTRFDPHELMDSIVRSRSDGQAFFITNGEAFGILDFAEVHDGYGRRPSHLEVQGTYEWLCDERRVQLVIERWSFEATTNFRWRRCIEDLHVELDSSSLPFCFVSFHSQLCYHRKTRYL
ncbi:hypothetical protein F5J12DRAFT_410481 [Pisolithus orientalis]|uniref:uncharacterized protein n=1 Tax=Pisolithus orientalis TaxID=936130 RepID=UPI00222407BB|nr:uncharacterized protein F5J12DRAFT_410481 [Pisolithus orientalis]KAI5994938.1 hypothetical protein F5J12DRAFT_410481 [Pisolithus orientalis]